MGEGDIAAKCFYGKKKFVWEMLRCGSKKKFEVQWSDISAIRAHFADKQPDILEVEVRFDSLDEKTFFSCTFPLLLYEQTNYVFI